MHATPVVIEDRLRHERDSLPMLFSYISNDVLEPAQLIRHVQEFSEP